ncbi:hypothetical protein COV53_04460 [Candidatus Gottesmanbacteria bacterium CG11_big_fil_rev_8_21_14_0_20_37_11]|uniref:Uncharacterized protein n=2 Tax=Microgenomates group TaxID=1794810 RepID=A0A2H0NGZ2_9BACT|nr:MAG: hypothetical protein COV53_04460 [Candidatus Gottesmanbacteria bacterium CG11_big_fil_rev_8_21_14_0_20_37_11]PIV09740.1 MAG: hypothetical protein COS51_01525 [Candidatus Roizmanbacteria bacterium CG03_land_8_20_14_0_80_36_21]PJE60135.1 MAG: hypothetical protein COU86_05970 [Candidatus Roizmanbacteria bacterium CG10_big_fil_rev_8_21_14_0_10_36_26]
MRNEDRGGLCFLMDDLLARQGGNPVDVWEGQLKTEPIQLTSDLRPAVEQYVQTIIGVTRMGSLRPDEYARKIIEENQGLPPTWRPLSKSVARVHERMVEDARKRNDEMGESVASALSTSFIQVIQSAGIRYEYDMGGTMRGLLDKFKRFPQESR